MFQPSQRLLQDRFDTRRLADRLEQVKVHAALSDADERFVSARDMLFLATCDAEGQPTCSIKAGHPGFIRVVDRETVLFPSYDGNGMFLSAGNVAATARVGLLFVDLEAGRRLRIEGDAEVVDDPSLVASFEAAQFVIRVRIRRVYPNCPRYIPTYRLVEPSPFLPRPGVTPPVPGWKRADWARDVLPAGDPARNTDVE
jgi:predicted pyridoxine 5'-phosphate oxidase superfamily flavin-nucleotide-binding protein